ncbi:energy-coupling factor transporter transmembrane protein EcfT [Clostridium estertheticum]|uniref:energy-coupling factor transporter transmembrane component T family protein n=1 Tax=Clostridium estertheticum TaxID=238834 RepID=UPI0013E96FCC|nr:energy-coupling factor transporter transmembrane component T [Clostridium estertheticum]MBZ9685552.1 energy-coupling factor transporter transmembrane protein EcfT [Clostridium estertheticum]
MKALSLYQEKDTVVHKVDPISKILYIIISIAIPIILPYKTIGLLCMGASIILLLIAKVFKKVIPLISFSMIILLSIIIIQGLFKAGNKTPAFHIGNAIFYKEGLLFALEICIRVINILCAFAILVLTTKPSDLIECLVRRGLSPKIGYVLSSVLQIIPQMTATMETITDAQRSRGMETEGKLSVRIKAFLPLIGPVVMNSLINTRERAMALEVRAFNSKASKTFLNEEQNGSYNKIIKIGLIFIFLLAVVWRVLI